MEIKKEKKLEDYKLTPADTSVIFKDNMHKPIHRWFHYTEGFSNEFVSHNYKKYGISSNSTVYEPFMGSGTVGLCSKLQNVNTLGVELNPLMHFISKVKNNFDIYSTDKVNDILHNLEFPVSPKVEPPNFLNNEKHFIPEIMDEVLKIKETVSSLPDVPEKDIFKLAFGNSLLRASNAKRVPSFGYKSKTNLNPELPYKLFKESLTNMVEDINMCKGSELGTSNIISGDAREQHFNNNIADLAITSPPYANGIDYVTDYQLEMGWLDLISKDDKKILRDGMIAYDKSRSPLLKEFYAKGEFYREENLMKIIKQLEEISNNYWKKDIHLVLLKYFDDMHKVLTQTYNILKPGSRFVLVLGDSLFKNVYVPTDLLIGIMGEEIGYEFETIEIARTRYSGQNRTYKLRETIVTLKK